MNVRWSENADIEREEIVYEIWRDNPGAAHRMDDLFRRAADRLGAFPFLGREGKIADTREFIPHSNYRIVYTVANDEIVILSLIHARRQWPPTSGDGA